MEEFLDSAEAIMDELYVFLIGTGFGLTLHNFRESLSNVYVIRWIFLAIVAVIVLILVCVKV